MIRIKRIYEAPEKDDGFRILVDRLWPRGMSKAKAKVDLWMKDIAPSEELRRWFGHDPKKCAAFKRRYRAELRSKQDLLSRIAVLDQNLTVTLLYAAKDEGCNNAVVLKESLSKKAA
jgi:uncharacterized protein YeaO (DUF488 family)